MKWSLGAALAVVSLAGPLVVAEDAASPTNSPPAPALSSVTNAPTPEAAEEDIENAPGQIVSAPAGAPADMNVSEATQGVIKLAQAGVDENVMLAFVTNSASGFGLTSDDIIYLQDVGVPSSVVTAMIQHDQATGAPVVAATNAVPETQTNQLAGTPGAPAPYAMPQPEPAQPQANVTYTYFYDSLAPYGSWIDVAGYGWCWRPTVVLVDPTWEPYCNRGHWVYTTSGWYWASDYSWGWAPFHYGRWFHHNRFGWCWAPDTVWGPSWVTWRYADDYCGWAPLPPTACFRPGIGFTYFGRSVGFNFNFGISAFRFTFVPSARFCDPHPFRYRVPRSHVTQVFKKTVVINQVITGNNNRIINRGIPVNRIRTATRTDIRPIQLREARSPGLARAERGNRSQGLAVFRPNLPVPQHGQRVVGEGIKPATRSIITRPQRTERPTRGNPAPERINRGERLNSPRNTRQNPIAPTPGIRPSAPTQPTQPAMRPETPSRGSRPEIPSRGSRPENRSGNNDGSIILRGPQSGPAGNTPNAPRIEQRPVTPTPSRPAGPTPTRPAGPTPTQPAAPRPWQPVTPAPQRPENRPVRQQPQMIQPTPPQQPSVPVQRPQQPQRPQRPQARENAMEFRRQDNTFVRPVQRDFPRAAIQNEQYNNSFQRSAPMVRSEPQPQPSPQPQMPRMERRSAPVQIIGQNSSSRGSDNSRQIRGNNGRGNRNR
ncbi:MAG TPA: DUF6600 domain-containing protein [Verrucomicrobiae bacterium]|nr:DUF6600 domain-containing protein [Verrucomicrobiae bacterium]